MKKNLAFVAVLTLVLTSCSDNDTASTTPPPAGTYSLIRVQGGLMGGNWQLPADKVVWNINTTQDSVTITNNAPQNGTPAGPASGIYAYKVDNR